MAGPLSEEKKKIQNAARRETMNNDFAMDRIDSLWKVLKNITKNEEVYPTGFYNCYKGEALHTETIIVEHGLFKIKIDFERK